MHINMEMTRREITQAATKQAGLVCGFNARPLALPSPSSATSATRMGRFGQHHDRPTSECWRSQLLTGMELLGVVAGAKTVIQAHAGERARRIKRGPKETVQSKLGLALASCNKFEFEPFSSDSSGASEASSKRARALFHFCLCQPGRSVCRSASRPVALTRSKAANI